MQPTSIRVLITGGSRGLGRALAEWLAAGGASVGLIARTPDDLHDVVTTIEGAGIAPPPWPATSETAPGSRPPSRRSRIRWGDWMG